MVPNNREGYSYLQVDRPIINRPNDFISKIAHIALKVFGAEPVAALSETSLHAEELDDGSVELDEPITRLITVREPLVDVYKPEDLRLILLRKSAPIEMSQKYNFNHKAAIFTANPRHTTKYKGKSYKRQVTIRESLDKISSEHGVSAHNTPIICDRIQDIPDIGMGTELALVAKVGSLSGIVVREQSKACLEKLSQMSPGTMYPSSPQIPFIPFMRIPEGVSNFQYERFIEQVNDQKLLPVRLIMDGMDAHSGRRQVMAQP